MFEIGDKIVHPLHGAGVVEDITVQKSAGVKRSYYVFRALQGNIVIMIPESSYETIGVRPVTDRETAIRLLDGLSEIECPSCDNWNRRYRENMEHLRSGRLDEILLVIKTLMLRERDKALSTGERKMLFMAKRNLYSELSLVLEITMEEMEARFTAALSTDRDA